MATGTELSIIGVKKYSGVASVAITQYAQVVINFETGAVGLAAAAGDICDGVALQPAAIGEPVEVAISGIVPVKIKTAASVIKNAYVQSDTDGQGIVATTADNAIILAKTAAGGNGDIILGQIINPVLIA